VVGVAAAGSNQTPTVSTTSAVSFLPSTGALNAVSQVSTSDERLKHTWLDIDWQLIEKLANVKAGTYTRFDTGLRQAGVSAQSMRDAIPEVVEEHPDSGFLSVAYGNAALVAAVALSRRVLQLEQMIKDYIKK
jgi:hypothetical protein